MALVANGEVEDGLPVFEFINQDTDFRGFEAEFDAELFTAGGFDVTGHAQADFVRATFNDDNGDAPRIPPFRALIGFDATSAYLDLGAELELAAEQNNIAEFEIPTDGYSLVNLSATWRPGGESSPMSVQLRADNLFDEDARLHSSFLKDVAPLRGRNIRVTLRGEF